MKLYCLTSVILEQNNITENEDIHEFKNYCFTLIEIGPNKYHVNVFNFQRDNCDLISLLMKPKSITIKSIDSKESGIIDLEFSNDANNPEKFMVKSMRISNIKVTKNSSVSEEERKKYSELINKLNQVHDNNAATIWLIKSTKFYAAKKSLGNRLRDFEKLILTFCDSNSQNSTKEIPETAKYLPKSSLKGGENVCIDKSNYHQKKRDNKMSWSKLTFNYVTMPRFDDVWFDAINLTELKLSNVKFDDKSQEGWTLFADGIAKLKFLKNFVVNGNFDEIPDIVFEKLPISLNILTLFGLKNISEHVSRLNHLKKLSICGDSKLITFPWNFLPESLTSLDLYGTGITEIPEEICRLVKLESFIFTENCSKSVKIPWAFFKNIKYINLSQIDFAELKYGNFQVLDELKITESWSENFDANDLPKCSKSISLIDCGIENYNISNFYFPYLNELNLSDNGLQEFLFECITKPMDKINLSKNYIKEIKLQNIANIKFLDLSRNKITKIVIPEQNDVEMEEYIVAEMILDLSYNEIKFLPYSFESLTIKELNICHNLFSHLDYKEIIECVWKRLPKYLTKLNISKNSIFRLPCAVRNLLLLKELIATECELCYICPRLFGNKSCCKLDIRDNSNLLGLSFAPSKIFPHIQNLIKPIKCENGEHEISTIFGEKISLTSWENYGNEMDDTSEEQRSTKILTNSTFLSTQNTRTIDLIFKPVKNLLNKHLFCKYCAKCGNETKQSVIKQLFTMDYELFQEEVKRDELICNCWFSKTWKTDVVTRFCETCIGIYKEEAKDLYITSKRKVVNDESEILEEQPLEGIYTEPQPCSSTASKFIPKKAKRRQSKIQNLNSANSQVNVQRANNEHVPMDVDVATEQGYGSGVQEHAGINRNQHTDTVPQTPLNTMVQNPGDSIDILINAQQNLFISGQENTTYQNSGNVYFCPTFEQYALPLQQPIPSHFPQSYAAPFYTESAPYLRSMQNGEFSESSEYSHLPQHYVETASTQSHVDAMPFDSNAQNFVPSQYTDEQQIGYQQDFSNQGYLLPTQNIHPTEHENDNEILIRYEFYEPSNDTI